MRCQDLGGGGTNTGLLKNPMKGSRCCREFQYIPGTVRQNSAETVALDVATGADSGAGFFRET